MGGFDPWAKPWGTERHPGGLLLRDAQGGLGQVRDPDAQRARSGCPRSRPRRCALFLNGPESFTPDNYFILGEAPEVRRYYVGAGFCSGGIAAAGGAGQALAEWIVEDRRADGSLAGRHPALRALPRQPALPARAGQRDRGRALLHRVPEPRAHERARAAPLAAARAAAGAPRLLRRQDGLGARQLVRARRRRAGDRLLLRPPELVPVLRGRAPRGPRGGGRLRPDLVRQAPARGRGRGGGAAAALRQRRGRAARPGGLHRACSTSAAASRAT